MRTGCFRDILGNLVKIIFEKNSDEPKEFYLLKDLNPNDCEVTLNEERIEKICNVGFEFKDS